MYKQIYDFDGNPKLIQENEEGIFEYDTNLFTEIEPPSSLYSPIRFDGKKWNGTNKESWEQAQSDEVITPDEKDMIIADLTVQLLSTQEEVDSLQKDIANLTLQILGDEANA